MVNKLKLLIAFFFMAFPSLVLAAQITVTIPDDKMALVNAAVARSVEFTEVEDWVLRIIATAAVNSEYSLGASNRESELNDLRGECSVLERDLYAEFQARLDSLNSGWE